MSSGNKEQGERRLASRYRWANRLGAFRERRDKSEDDVRDLYIIVNLGETMVIKALKHGYQTLRTIVQEQLKHLLGVQLIHAVLLCPFLKFSNSCQSHSTLCSLASLLIHQEYKRSHVHCTGNMQMWGEGPRLRATNSHSRHSTSLTFCFASVRRALEMSTIERRKESSELGWSY